MTDLKITVISDDFCPKPNLMGEHGFSLLLETKAGNVLFDTGQGIAFKHNVGKLGLDNLKIDAVVISHGHDDHAGGLKQVKEIYPHLIKVYAHPEIFAKRYKYLDNGQEKSTGIPFTYEELCGLDIDFKFITEPTMILENVWATGQIPRDFETPPKMTHFILENGKKQADAFVDDQALVVDTDKGLILLLGCAHAGVKTTLEYVLRFMQRKQVYAVIGGMHLLNSDEKTVMEIASYLNQLKVKFLAPSHCTGIKQSALLSSYFSGDFSILGSGSILKF